MKSDDLNSIWEKIELQKNSNELFWQKMVYVDLVYRVYIGASGIPSKRFLSVEVPENEVKEFESFTVPQGFTFAIGSPGVKHDGYVSFFLEAANSDLNDVFAIVVKDILDELRKQSDPEKYIVSLKQRIQKWRDFFKIPSMHRLSEKASIGLIGELMFIKHMMNLGIKNASEMWNGPIKASQDFQWERVAVEVKTTASSTMEFVHISSEMQLDSADRDSLFLVAYRLERNDASGISLPEMIMQVSDELEEHQRARFHANLTCLGYFKEDESCYSRRYSLKECKSYQVNDSFPKILKSDLPNGIKDISYKISLKCCEELSVEFNEIYQSILEHENG